MNSFNRRRMYQALCVAIETNESLIGAYRTELSIKNGIAVRSVAKENRSIVSRFRRDIAAWKRCLQALKQPPRTGGAG